MHRITNTGRVNLGHLFWLRTLAIIGQLVTIAVVQTFFDYAEAASALEPEKSFSRVASRGANADLTENDGVKGHCDP